MIKIVQHNSQDYQKMLDLRLKVLRHPLGMTSFTNRELEMDVESIHIAAFSGDEVIGTLILTRKDSHALKMRQVCVNPAFQSQSVGRKMVFFAEEYAVKAGYKVIELHARASVSGWYSTLGFASAGDEFLEVGLPHFQMAKTLVLAN